MPSCIFDEIASGSASAHVVADEEDFVAFLDSRPVFFGHTLVIPRQHFATLAELPSELLPALLDTARRVAVAQRDVLGAQGNFFCLNEVVSQSVPHAHMHVVPRRHGDGLRGFLWPRHKYPDEATAQEIAARLRAAVPAP